MTLWRKVWRRILLWGGVTSLFGCVTYGEPQSITGIVTERTYTPARTEQVWEPNYSGNGGYTHQGMSVGGMRYRTQYHAAVYRVEVSYGGESGVVYDKGIYQQTAVGDSVKVLFHYPITKDSVIDGPPSIVAVYP